MGASTVWWLVFQGLPGPPFEKRRGASGGHGGQAGWPAPRVAPLFQGGPPFFHYGGHLKSSNGNALFLLAPLAPPFSQESLPMSNLIEDIARANDQLRQIEEETSEAGSRLQD